MPQYRFRRAVEATPQYDGGELYGYVIPLADGRSTFMPADAFHALLEAEGVPDGQHPGPAPRPTW